MRRGSWFPGYTVAGVATVVYLASAPGQTFVISQFNTSFREAFGIEALTLNAAYTVATVLASLPLAMVGRLTDRIGPRRMLAATAFAFGLACLFMSAAGGAAAVFVGFFLLRLLGMGSMVLASQHAVAMWFHRRLGSVHGVKQVVVFGLWVLFPQLTVAMIEALGWRWVYAVFGVGVWAAVVPLALALVRDRPEELGLRPDNDPPGPARNGAAGGDELEGADAVEGQPGAGPAPDPEDAPAEVAFTLREAARTRAYWTLTAAFFLPPLIGTAMLFDIQPILAQRGLSAADAAAAVSVWTATMAVMALPAGVLTDRVAARVLVPAGLGAIGSSAALLWAAGDVWMAASALAMFGLGQSLMMASGTAAIARYFGRAHHGAIRGSITRIGVIGTGLGPLVTGLSAWATGGYFAALALFAAVCVPVAVVGMGLVAPRGEGLDRTARTAERT